MQIKLVIDDNFEEFEEEEDRSIICLKSYSSISSWIIDYYFKEIFSKQIQIMNQFIQPENIIGNYDMFRIYQLIESSSSSLTNFHGLCQNKLKQIQNNFLLDKYNNYLKHCGLIDIIDLFHQCQLNQIIKTMILSLKNIQNNIDQLIFEYLIELSSISCEIYDIKTKLTIKETNENLLKLIDKKTTAQVTTNNKNDLKHILCTYLSLLLDTRNEYALIHCLITSERLKQEIIFELQCLSKNNSLTIYQILLSFLRRKELILNRKSSSLSHDYDNQSFDKLDKSYKNLKEFFDFIEQLRIIIEENEHSKIESNLIFRKLLELIIKQLRKNISFKRYDSIIKEIIDELCQCFQTTISLMNFTSPIRSASSGATLAGRRFLRSIAFLCAKQTIDLPILISNDDINSPTLLPMVNDHSNKSRCTWQSRTIRKYRSLDLSIIHETSFESDSIIDKDIDHHHPINFDNKTQSKLMVKRQPLREIDINSFNIECETIRSQNPLVFKLVSDGDKENIPVITKKRSIISTKNELSNKKHKKINLKSPEIGQKMITSFFQSTN